MRDVPPAGRRRIFANNVDDYISSGSNYDSADYDSLKAQSCPDCNQVLFYDTKFNHLICQNCGLILDLNERESSQQGEDSFFGGGATTAHGNRKDGFAEDNSNNVPAVIPMAQRRTGIHKLPEWSDDQDAMRLEGKGYRITNYSSVVVDDRKTIPPGGHDFYFEERQQDEHRKEGKCLSTDSGLGENRRKFISKS